MTATVTIPGRFNGPKESGNGGYTSGVLATRLSGPVEVNLRSSVPLDDPLELVGDEGPSLRLLHGETLIAEARPVSGVDVTVPAAVDPARARRASENYRASSDGVFSSCFDPRRGDDVAASADGEVLASAEALLIEPR